MIYFIRCTATNLVKIGYAEDPYKRFSKVQSDSPGELKLVGIEPGDKVRERELHRHFAEHRVRGEWFNYVSEIADYVATIIAPLQTRRRKKLGGKLGEWLHDNQMTLATFADLVGSTAVSVSRFCAGQHIPGKCVMEAIVRVTNGAVMPNDFFDLSFLESTPTGSSTACGLVPELAPVSGTNPSAAITRRTHAEL